MLGPVYSFICFLSAPLAGICVSVFPPCLGLFELFSSIPFSLLAFEIHVLCDLCKDLLCYLLVIALGIIIDILDFVNLHWKDCC